MVHAQHIANVKPSQRTLPSWPATEVAGLLVNALLAASVLVAITVFICGSLPAMLGFKMMVVSSGSMEPAIRVGDAVAIKPLAPEAIHSGDVITFASAAGQGMVTHRVIAIKEIEGDTYLQTKGDANATPDPNLTPAGAVYGKVALTLPKAGYLLYYTATPWGKLLVIGVPLLILMGQELRKLLQDRKSPHQGQEQPTPDRTEPHEAPASR